MDLVPKTMHDVVARRFKVLSEPVRLALLNALHAQGELSVQALVKATGLRQANVSKHLGLMAEANVLGRRKEGLYVYYRIVDPTLAALCSLVCGQLRQEAFAAQTQQQAHQQEAPTP